MKVKLIAYTPEPEKVIAIAAKLCYSDSNIENIMEGLTEENISKFIDTLMSLGHQSPLEHVNFTFGIEGVSRTLTHQLVRHRLASYSQQSQRYVNLNKSFEYVAPIEILNNYSALGQFELAMENAFNSYVNITAILKEEYVNKGMSLKNAEKKAIENARAVLPNACETKIICTMNARELLHFFNERGCHRAQDEINELAWAMIRICRDTAPQLFSNAGPSCLRGKCKEGKMTCGHPYTKED